MRKVLLSRISLVFSAFAALAFCVALPATAQQYVVDDAAIVDPGACHLEAWHGRHASWILPACQPISNWEFAAGVGFVDEGDGAREPTYALEAKTLLRSLSPNDWGIGIVLGLGPNPSAVPGERRLGDVYAFLPASLSLSDDLVVLHGNAGWQWDRADRQEDGGPGEGDHEVTWGVRADLGLFPDLTAIGELSEEGSARPEYQSGVRIHLPDAGIEIDLSWGGHLEEGERGARFTAGVQFVSGRIFGVGGET